jgi:signal transduction histidine kinase
MARANRAADTWTVVFDYDGNVLVNTLVPFGTSFPKAEYEWVAPLIDGQQSSVSELRIGVVSKVPVVSVNVPVSTLTGKRYLISQIFRADHFTALLNSDGINENWIVNLFDSNGIIIARNAEEEKFVGKPVNTALYTASRQERRGQVRHITLNDVDVYGVFTRTNDTRWTVSIGIPVEEFEAAVRRATLFATLALVLTFAFATFAIFFIARRLTCAVDDAVDAAKTLGQGHVPDIKTSGVEEVNLLQGALHNAGVALSRENTARRNLEKEREALLISEQRARKQAEDQNKSKDNFLATLGHELRNPLAPIRAAADVLSAGYADDEHISKTSAIITRQTEHMSALIDDLLDVARVTKGLVTLEKSALDANHVVSIVVEQVRPLVEVRRHHLAVHMPSEAAFILGDKKRLVQVLTNLLTNAVRYTPEGGNINLKMALDDEHVIFEVSDNGIGMTPELVDRAFEMFEQAERSPDRSEGGLGIGLALVKSLVQLHGGSVSVHSTGPGHGTAFTVRFPRLVEASADKNKRDGNSL